MNIVLPYEAMPAAFSMIELAAPLPAVLPTKYTQQQACIRGTRMPLSQKTSACASGSWVPTPTVVTRILVGDPGITYKCRRLDALAER